MSNTLLTLFHVDRYKEYYRTGMWRDDTVYSLVRDHADRTPERIAVRSRYGDLTYRQLVDFADAFAGDLADHGVVAG